MIDLSKAPEGATHYGVSIINGICWYIVTDGKYKYIYDRDVGECEWSDGVHSRPAHDIKPINNWTIYNNTKPLCELTEEQRGLLFNFTVNGGSREAVCGHSNIEVSNHTWFPDAVYRAKQKSERELFIEAALDAMKLHPDDLAKRDIGKMFDAGFKAPLQTKEG